MAAFFSPRVTDLYVAAERAREARRAEELVLNQHKGSRGRDHAGGAALKHERLGEDGALGEAVEAVRAEVERRRDDPGAPPRRLDLPPAIA